MYARKIMLNEAGVKMVGVAHHDLTAEKAYNVQGTSVVKGLTYVIVKNDRDTAQYIHPDYYVDVLNVFTVGQN